jgi:single-stranded-DNA-specific exonuclease
MPDALAGMIDFLSIKGPINSYHIGYVIGPRINAAGRITSPYDSLNILLTSGNDQLNKLQALEQINTDRRKLQDDALKHAKNNISIDAPIIMVYDESYHE